MVSEEVHLAGSPLDLYLAEFGNDFADAAVAFGTAASSYSCAPGVGTQYHGLRDTIGHETSDSAPKVIATDVASEVMHVYSVHGLWPTSMELRLPSQQSTALMVCFGRSGFSMIAGMSFLILGYGRIAQRIVNPRTLWCARGVMVTYAAWSIVHISTYAWRAAYWHCVLTEARRAALALQNFWATARHATCWTQESELSPCSMEGVRSPMHAGQQSATVFGQSRKIILSSVSTFNQQLRHLADSGSCHTDELAGREGYSVSHSASLKSILSRTWQVQAEILTHSVKHLREGEFASVVSMLRDIAWHANQAQTRISQELRFARAWHKHQLSEASPFRNYCHHHPKRAQASTAVRLALAIAYCILTAESEQQDPVMQTVSHLLDQMACHLDAAQEVLCGPRSELLSPLVESEIASPHAAIQGCAQPDPIAHAEFQGTGSQVCLRQPNDVTWVHTSEGTMSSMSEPVCRMFNEESPAANGPEWRSCLQELRGVLRSRSREVCEGDVPQTPVVVGCDNSVCGSSYIVDGGCASQRSRPVDELVRLEAIGSGPPLERPTLGASARRVPYVGQTPGALELLNALELRICGRRGASGTDFEA